MPTYCLLFWCNSALVPERENLKNALPIFPDSAIDEFVKVLEENPKAISFNEMNRHEFISSFVNIKKGLDHPCDIDTRCDWTRFTDSIRMLEVIDEIEKNKSMRVFGCFVDQDTPLLFKALDELPTKMYSTKTGGFAVIYDSI